MFARLILVFLGAVTLILLTLGFVEDRTYAAYAIPFFLGLATVYVMSPQINWWFYSKRPPKLPLGLQKMIEKQSAFYQRLSEDGKQKFRERMALNMMNWDFMPMVIETIPEDLKAALAANVVHLTFGQEEYHFEEFEKVIIYPTAFPSPQFPKQFHTSEIYPEDGVLMFAAEHLLKGFIQPHLYYNSGLHEAIQIFLHLYSEKPYPNLPEDIWEQLAIISNFPEAGIREWIGLEEINPLAVTICHFLMFPEQFNQTLPEVYDQLMEVVGFDPMMG
ncbi:MAG: zinc-dependent peptidase [Bacteroidota bacterium]